MEENEIVTIEGENIEDTDEIVEDNKIGTGLAALIGSAVTLAVIAGVKQVKKAVQNRRAKKEVLDDEEETDEPEEENDKKLKFKILNVKK